MKICVLGAGVIGVSTAYMLARQGHEVCVIDGGTDVATGASQANGAQLSYSHAEPFASPATLRKLPGFILGTDHAVRFGLSLSPAYLGWGLKFLSQCNSARFAENLKQRTALANLSRETMSLIDRELDSNLLTRTGQGKIVLASSKAEFAHMQNTARLRSDQKCLDAQQCIAIEPALATWRTEIVGGVYAQDDSALDPVLYCKALEAALVTRFGSKFYWSRTIQNIRINDANDMTIETGLENFRCDAAIICLGNDPNGLLKKLNLKVPINPVQGYSLTLKTTQTSPKVSITDLKNKIVYANLGDSIRIAGFMDTNQKPARAKARGEHLLHTAKQVWPDIAQYEGTAQHWTHFRPMVPSGVPIIGETKHKGLYLNVGHGSLGYTFAAGSAMKIAQALEQNTGDRHKNYEHYLKRVSSCA